MISKWWIVSRSMISCWYSVNRSMIISSWSVNGNIISAWRTLSGSMISGWWIGKGLEEIGRDLTKWRNKTTTTTRQNILYLGRRYSRVSLKYHLSYQASRLIVYVWHVPLPMLKSIYTNMLRTARRNNAHIHCTPRLSWEVKGNLVW